MGTPFLIFIDNVQKFIFGQLGRTVLGCLGQFGGADISTNHQVRRVFTERTLERAPPTANFFGCWCTRHGIQCTGDDKIKAMQRASIVAFKTRLNPQLCKLMKKIPVIIEGNSSHD